MYTVDPSSITLSDVSGHPVFSSVLGPKSDGVNITTESLTSGITQGISANRSNGVA